MFEEANIKEKQSLNTKICQLLKIKQKNKKPML